MEFRDASAMAEAVQNQQVSPKELVLDAIQRIEEKNPDLNAVVWKQYEAALARAETMRIGKQAFAGVPILLKDLGQNQAGQVSSSGSRLFRDYRPSYTDHLVQKLEKLGFIVLGRTNTPEFGFKNISDSQLHGPVNLPRDCSRNAGGSSGGAAAAVAAGMVPLAGASDGGGSIRIPASFNGLIGLKPSRGRIPQGPYSYQGWQGASSHFALTKTMRDTKTLLFGLQECQMEGPFPLPLLSHKTAHQTDKKLRIAYSLVSPIDSKVSKEAQEAVLQTLDFLRFQGHELVELADYPIQGRQVIESYYMMNSVETAQMFDGIEKSLGRQMTLDDMELMTWAIYQSGQSIPAKVYSRVLQDWDRYSVEMANFHQDYDLLLTPTVASVAPFHHQFDLSAQLTKDLKRMADFSWKDQQGLIWEMFSDSLAWTPFTIFANLTGQPAISLPVYETKDDLPIGVQLIAAKSREDLLLQLGQEMEEQEFLLEKKS